MAVFLYVLLYPWLRAHFWAAYWDFTKSDDYFRKIRHELPIVNIYLKCFMDEYLKTSWNAHWKQIVFMPWTFDVHPDFIEGSIK